MIPHRPTAFRVSKAYWSRLWSEVLAFPSNNRSGIAVVGKPSQSRHVNLWDTRLSRRNWSFRISSF